MKNKFTPADFTMAALIALIFYGLFNRFAPDLFDTVGSGLSFTAMVGRNIIIVALFSYLIINIFTDIIFKKVFNIFSLAALIFGLVANFMFNGPTFFLQCLLGAIVGFTIFLLPFFADSKIGAYVKALTVIGALMGVKFLLWTTLFVLILSEIVRFVFKIREKGFKVTFRKISKLKDESTIFRDEEDIMKSENLNIIPFGLTVLLAVLLNFYFIS